MIVINCVKMLTNMTDEAGGYAEKKAEVTVIPTAPVTPPTEACLAIRIEEDKPMRPYLSQSYAVLRTERCGHIKERHGAHQAAVHAIAADGHHQPKILLNLCGPPPISL